MIQTTLSVLTEDRAVVREIKKGIVKLLDELDELGTIVRDPVSLPIKFANAQRVTAVLYAQFHLTRRIRTALLSPADAAHLADYLTQIYEVSGRTHKPNLYVTYFQRIFNLDI